MSAVNALKEFLITFQFITKAGKVTAFQEKLELPSIDEMDIFYTLRYAARRTGEFDDIQGVSHLMVYVKEGKEKYKVYEICEAYCMLTFNEHLNEMRT